jgi:hypothetical protein
VAYPWSDEDSLYELAEAVIGNFAVDNTNRSEVHPTTGHAHILSLPTMLFLALLSALLWNSITKLSYENFSVMSMPHIIFIKICLSGDALAARCDNYDFNPQCSSLNA